MFKRIYNEVHIQGVSSFHLKFYYYTSVFISDFRKKNTTSHNFYFLLFLEDNISHSSIQQSFNVQIYTNFLYS